MITLLIFALAASGMLAAPRANPDSPYAQAAYGIDADQLVDEVAAQHLASTIAETARITAEQLQGLLAELDAAEARQKALIERHQRLTRYGDYRHPRLQRLDQPLRQGQAHLTALRTQTTRARGLARTLSALDGALGALSVAESLVEGAQFLEAADTLSSLGGASREAARLYQRTVDEVVAQNDLYSPSDFLLRLRSDCTPGAAAWATCAGLAFNTFSRLVANLAVQEAAIQQMLDSSSEIIASRIQRYAELGARHAREGRPGAFDRLDRPAILDVEVLARSTDTVINLLDNRSLWVKWLRGSEHDALVEGAEALRRDLARGADSSVMQQFRAAYQAAHESARIEVEIQQLDERIARLVPEITALSARLERIADQMRELMQGLENAAQTRGESSAETCEENLDSNYAAYARPTDECDAPNAETDDTGETDETSPNEEEGSAEEDRMSLICRALDRPLPAGLSSTDQCGILTPQPTADQFVAACEGNHLKDTHTCTVVYCNHVFYRWGAEDIVDCVAKIAAQKDRRTQ
jgi:hypothetical protein